MGLRFMGRARGAGKEILALALHSRDFLRKLRGLGRLLERVYRNGFGLYHSSFEVVMSSDNLFFDEITGSLEYGGLVRTVLRDRACESRLG